MEMVMDEYRYTKINLQRFTPINFYQFFNIHPVNKHLLLRVGLGYIWDFENFDFFGEK